MRFFRAILMTAALVPFLEAYDLRAWAANQEAAFSAGTDIFIQQAQLVANDKADGAQFGGSVAVSGDTALIGAPNDSTIGSLSGAAYVFRRDTNGEWQEEQKLTASDGAAVNFFGDSVAISGDVALIGARGNNNTQGNFAGAAYIFIRDLNGHWNELQKLTASDGASGNLFGSSVALGEQIALVGARGNEDSNSGFPGAVYVFTQGTDGYWNRTQKLIASDGTAGDGFGYSVVLNGDSAFIGARNADDKGGSSGAAYAFAQGGDGQWSQAQKLLASDGAAGDEFGYSVAVNGGTAFVGARFAGGVEESRAGAVYVFTFGTGPIGTRWDELQKLTASAGETGDEFGSSVALSDTIGLIGAKNDGDKGTSAGAVYVFTLTQADTGSSQWRQLQKLSARDGSPGDQFGFSLALSGDAAFVGTPFDDVITDDKTDTSKVAGAVHLLGPTPLPTACTMKTDYDTDKCSGTFTAASLIDLDEYIAEDFGKKDNKGKYRNLKLTGSLDYIILDIMSPCKITLQGRITLSGDFVSIDGRKGVFASSGYEIDAKNIACVLSEQDRTELGTSSLVDAGALTLQAAKAATIGKNSSVSVDEDLVVVSTGTSSSGTALIDAGSIVTAGTITVQAVQGAQLGEDTIVTADGAAFLVSTGTASGSKAGVQARAQVKATDLTISSAREAKIGKNTTTLLSGNLTLISTESSSKSQAIIDEGARVTVAGDAEMMSGNKATLGSNTVVTVTHNFDMEAAKCTVKSSAAITVGSKSGNCL